MASTLTVPRRVRALLVEGEPGFWQDAWDADTGRSRYLSRLIGRGRLPVAEGAASGINEQRPDEGLPLDTGINEEILIALRSLLQSYRHHVHAGHMRLVDPDEAEELAGKDVHECNVLLEFSDLRILLEEFLSEVNRDCPLSPAQRDRVVDSCYSWMAGLGDDLLSVHYRGDVPKIAAAQLVRMDSGIASSPVGSPSLGGSSSKPSRRGPSSREWANCAVPFQEVRFWAENSRGLLLGRVLASPTPPRLRSPQGSAVMLRQASWGEEVTL